MLTNIQLVMYIVSSIGAGMSALVSSFVVYVYSRNPDFRTFSCRLTRFLSLTDFFLSISFILPSEEANWLCDTQAILITYFLLASILWTAAISHAAYTVTSESDYDEHFLMRRYLVLAYGAPILAFLLPLVKNEYGEAEGWCWISASGVGAAVFRFICYYIPLCLVITYNIIQYRRILRELDDQDSARQISKRLKLYPWILVITQMTLTLHRLIYFLFGVYWTPIAIVGVLLNSLMGLINALLYGFNDTMIEYILNMCRTGERNETSMDSLENSIVHHSLNR